MIAAKSQRAVQPAGVLEAIDAAAGPIKRRNRGLGAGDLLAAIAAAQQAGEDFLVGLDRQRADAAGQQVMPVPGAVTIHPDNTDVEVYGSKKRGVTRSHRGQVYPQQQLAG